MAYKDKAEQYVRQKLSDQHLGISKPIHLEHWLMVLPENRIYTKNGEVYSYWGNGLALYFNLTTGQPATEADYRVFCEIVGVQ